MGIHFEIKRARPLTSTMKENRPMLSYIIGNFEKPGDKEDLTIFGKEKSRTVSKNWKDIDWICQGWRGRLCQ